MLGTHMASILFLIVCCIFILLNCIHESKTSIMKYTRNKFKSFLSQEIVVNILLLDLVLCICNLFSEECEIKFCLVFESLARVWKVIELI